MNEPRVLFVVDPTNREWLKVNALEEKGYGKNIVVEGGFDALHELMTNGADMMVTMTALPDISGYQLCSLVKSNDRTTSMPVLIVKSDDEDGQDKFWTRASLADEIVDILELKQGITTIHELLDRVMKKGMERDWKAERAKSLLPEITFTTAEVLRSYGNLLDVLLIERLITRVVRALSGVVEPRKQFLDAYFGVVDELFGCDVLGIVVANPSNPWLAIKVKNGLNKKSYEEFLAQTLEKLQLPGEPQTELRGELNDKGGPKIQLVDVLPVAGEKSGIGAIIFGSYDKKEFSTAAKSFISQLQLHMQPLLKLLLAKQEIEILQSQQAYSANVDSLTGLYNLEFLVGFLQQQLLFSFRQRLPVGLAIIDVDHLATVNEEHGYDMGDVVLTAIANRLLAITRSSDLIARYGGDEFAVVLPNTDDAGAKILGEKVRSDIEGLSFVKGRKGPKVTVSIGCASFNMEDLNPETILRDAKIALQRAKEDGHNKVAAGENAS